MAIPIDVLWFTQRNLDIVDFEEAMRDDEYRERILLRRCSDGEFEIINGHHRVTALWAKGREFLKNSECTVVESRMSYPRFHKLSLPVGVHYRHNDILELFSHTRINNMKMIVDIQSVPVNDVPPGDGFSLDEDNTVVYTRIRETSPHLNAEQGFVYGVDSGGDIQQFNPEQLVWVINITRSEHSFD